MKKNCKIIRSFAGVTKICLYVTNLLIIYAFCICILDPLSKVNKRQVKVLIQKKWSIWGNTLYAEMHHPWIWLHSIGLSIIQRGIASSSADQNTNTKHFSELMKCFPGLLLESMIWCWSYEFGVFGYFNVKSTNSWRWSWQLQFCTFNFQGQLSRIQGQSHIS